ICVTGPTGCGKTALGVLLAERFSGEVVSADSMQIYRGMAIGSAAPTPEETRGIPHYMIAVAEPSESWSVARYVDAAAPIVDDILSRGKRPLLVGGTGLWMEALLRQGGFAPGQSGGEVRRELEAELRRDGIGPLLAQLREVDPDAAARIHPSDEKRILRALEVYRETGRTITAHNLATRALPPRYRAVWLGLRYSDRAEMKAALNRRVDSMMKAGLLEEVRALSERVPRDATALQAIGYKELLPVLDGEKTLQEGVEEVKLRTRQYAKRQLTWFRRNPGLHWLERREGQDFSEVVDASTNFLRANGVC
ncbi:MAG: tRNA (adenosine(37)-N6)-dimethylallyltransferase MiaA, partial [Oscillibacter sp.]|nr:tRNA (adenosine(37)-N6)-dimethylallyltransferase MiaA [Oscillibacter sp.]